MKKINSIHIIWIGLFFSCSLAFGQEEEENNIGVQEVTITKSYTPSLSEVFKIRAQPSIIDSIGREKRNISYSIFSVPVASTFIPSKGGARILQKRKITPKYNATLSSALGNFSHFYLDHSAQINLDRRQYVSWLVNFNGLLKNLSEQTLNTKQSSFLVHLAHQYNTNDLSSSSQLFFRNNSFNFYGLQNPIEDKFILDNLDPRQQLNSLSFKSNWQWFDIILKEISLTAHLTTDKFNTNELQSELNTKLQFNIWDIAIGADVSTRYLNNKFKADYFSDTASSFLSGISQADLFATSNKNRFKFKAGVRAAYGFGDDFDKKNFYLFPILNLSYQPNKGNLIPFLDASGEITQNSFRGLTDINPYTAPAIALKNSSIPYEFKAGIRTKIFVGWEFIMNAYYQKQENRPLYRNFGYDNTNPNYDAFRYGNSFEVIYKEIETTGFDTSISAKFRNGGSLYLKALWRDYSVLDKTEAWNLPEIQFDFKANIKVREKFYAQADVTFFGARKNSYRQRFLLQLPEDAPERIADLPSFFDAGIKFTYQFNSRWELYVKGENLFNAKEYHWSNYQVYGTRVLGGIRYNFDISF